MRRGTDTGLLIGLFLVLFVGTYFIAGSKPTKENKISTTYNADRCGVKAFYTLLGERLGFKVGRLTEPYDRIPREARVLVVVQPLGAFSVGEAEPDMGPGFSSIGEEERRDLRGWVRGGGVVIFASTKLRNVPFGFRETRKIGSGMVYAFDTREIITNRGMRSYRNATRVLDVITRHAGKRDLILFDEYHHGIAESPSMWDRMGRQVKVALGVLCAAILLGVYSQGRRFGAVRELPARERIRPGVEFVESVGRLYQRAHATDVAAEIIGESFRHSLCAKLGLPADASREQIASGLKSYGIQGCADRVEGVIARCERHRAGHKPSERELVEIAREVRELEKELNLERV